MPPAVAIQGATVPLDARLTAPAGAAFLLLADLAPGPVDVLQQRFYVGLSPALTPLAGGLVPTTGTFVMPTVALPAIAGLAGTRVHGQAVVLDGNANNGLFVAGNAASTTYFASTGAVVASFDDPVANGFTGNFAADLDGQVRNLPVTTRTVTPQIAGSVPFQLPIASPLQPGGCREQVVYTAAQVGATGARERLTAVRWTPLGAVSAQVIPQFEMRVGHTDVTPDYSIDPWSALPMFPDSGLSATFADNERVTDLPVRVHGGSYVIDPAAVLPNGTIDYPMSRTFDYDGLSSLLLDFRVGPGGFQPLNGMLVHLASQASAFPGARNVALGSGGVPLDPGTVLVGSPDNAMPVFELEFATVDGLVVSPWLDAQVAQPDYGDAIPAAHLPFGTAISFEFRGATGALGQNATPWSSTPNVADGHRFLQFRATMRADHATGERPTLDTLVVPFQ